MNLLPNPELAPHTNYRCTSCGTLIAVCEPWPTVDPSDYMCLACLESVAVGKLAVPARAGGNITRDAPEGAFVVYDTNRDDAAVAAKQDAVK